MHEMSIAQNIIDIIDDTLPNPERSNLKSVVIDIGKLCAVVPESLQFCFETIIGDTKYNNAKLKINIIPIKVICNNCSEESKIENNSFLCPICDSSNIQVISGEELNIKYLEVD